MAQQTINVGAAPNDGTGTPLRTAFQYTNSNFSELYTAVGPSGNNIVVPGTATITGDLTVDTSTLVVNSSQNRVGIGFSGSASSGRLQISQPLGSTIDGALRITDDATTSFVFNNVSSGVSGIWSSGAIAFGVGSGTFTEAMRLNTTANLVLKGGTIGANGVGLTFPATQVASSDANCLDDYEEGTWTGTLTGSTTNPTVAVTATGRYTKIGRQVSISINFENISTAGALGNIGISGLPFANNASVQSIGPTSIYQTGTFTGSPFTRVDTLASVIEFYASVSNSAFSNVTHNAGTGRFIATSVSYTVA
jgi:hypothetical protein